MICKKSLKKSSKDISNTEIKLLISAKNSSKKMIKKIDKTQIISLFYNKIKIYKLNFFNPKKIYSIKNIDKKKWNNLKNFVLETKMFKHKLKSKPSINLKN